MDPAWLLLFVPGTWVLLAAILGYSGLAEQHLLSPRALIAGAVRTRRNTPDYAEALVVRQVERLLRESGRR